MPANMSASASPNMAAASAERTEGFAPGAMNTPHPLERTAVAVDIDPPFQLVLAAWLGAHAYRVRFMPLAAALCVGGPVHLVVCELAQPKQGGEHTLRELARAHPGAPLLAISSRFVDGARCGALARQIGAQAALAKPCSRYDFDAALDAAVAMPSKTHPAQDALRAAQRPRHGR